MTKIYRIIAVVLTSLFLLSSNGCGQKGSKIDQDNYKSSEYCVMDGKTMYFLAEEDKQILREPLIQLLSNETCAIYADTPIGDIIGYEPHDPNKPSIPEGDACGLYDVTSDGMPELLVRPKGYYGTSGSVVYEVYDVFSGEYLGSMDGAIDTVWGVYYFRETDELRSVGSYWRRGGWSDRYRVMTFLHYDKKDNTCYEEVYLYAHFQISGQRVPANEINTDGLLVEKWVESYPYARYKAYGEIVDLDEYYGELDWFHANCIRIPETELQMISWWDVCSSEDRFERAEQMADALLSSNQKFIVSRTE